MILTNKFGMSQTWSGVIMAMDNVLALFMLPLFGALSDKVNTRFGKRTPFITVGTVLAACAILALSFVDNMQLKNIHEVSKIDDPAALEIIYQTQGDKELKTPEGEEFVLNEMFSKEDFVNIQSKTTDAETGKETTTTEYMNYVTPARQAYVAEATAKSPNVLICFVVLLFVLLLAMSTFRSPAVALMPDVTIKPLRSKANAIINLMGALGGIIYLIITTFLYKTTSDLLADPGKLASMSDAMTQLGVPEAAEKIYETLLGLMLDG